MEVIIFTAVIAFQFAYIVYQDISNRKEREKLQLKLMSKDVGEYKEAVEPPPEEAEVKPSPYKGTSEVPIDELMKAEDKI